MGLRVGVVSMGGKAMTTLSPPSIPLTYHANSWHERLSPMDQDNERVILALFALIGKPRTMLDLGCGTGIMAQTARRLGVDAVGIDQIAEYPNVRHDLTRPMYLGRRFDLILSLEVAEHLPDVSAVTFCETITAHRHDGTKLIFSAALPQQGGHEHVNERSPKYWRDLLYKVGGWSLREDLTAKLSLIWTLTAGAAANWLPATVQVF